MNHRSKLSSSPRGTLARAKGAGKLSLLAPAIAVAIAGGSLAGAAYAADDSSLTWGGVTLYGTYDIGVVHDDHGTPVSKYWGQGVDYLIAKQSNTSRTTVGPDGLSQSKIGIKGDEPFGSSGISFVFNAEVGFQPNSLELTDGPKSLTKNNGVALANQTAASDSSRAGQFFNGQLFGGIGSKDFGTFTFGRQNTLLLDNINSYDPMGGSYAFSLIGFSGACAGGGDTEDARANNSFKYVYKTSIFHFGGMYQADNSDFGQPGSGWQADVGFAGEGFAADAVYAHKNDAISASSLSAAQLLKYPSDSLAATISDNTSYTLDASYTFDEAKLFGGYEHVRFENPTDPLSAPFDGLGGYEFSVITQNAYTNAKQLEFYWLGARYSFTSNFDLTGAYYHLDQNSYKGNGCSNNSAGSCSGAENVWSIMGDYKFNKHFDAYAGVAFSRVQNGLSNGFLNTSNADPMIGVRFRF
jgi:predicted porin